MNRSTASSADRRSASRPATGWVLYDAECGVCRRWVPSWAPWLERLGLAVAPLQTGWVAERTGLSRAELLQDIRLLEHGGRLHSGADVYRYLMRRTRWAYPLYLLSLAPGFRLVFDFTYRMFARHRMRIAGSCGLPGAG